MATTRSKCTRMIVTTWCSGWREPSIINRKSENERRTARRFSKSEAKEHIGKDVAQDEWSVETWEDGRYNVLATGGGQGTTPTGKDALEASVHSLYLAAGVDIGALLALEGDAEEESRNFGLVIVGQRRRDAVAHAAAVLALVAGDAVMRRWRAWMRLSTVAQLTAMVTWSSSQTRQQTQATLQYKRHHA